MYHDRITPALEELHLRGIIDGYSESDGAIVTRIDEREILIDARCADRFLSVARLWAHVADQVDPRIARAA